jgi:hypothetical protein
MLSPDVEAAPLPDAHHASHDGLKGITGRFWREALESDSFNNSITT